MQTSSPPPQLSTSYSLPTIFFLEQGPVASMLTKHLPFPLSPKDQPDSSPRATLHSAVTHMIPLYTCKSLHSVLSGKGNLYLEY